ncbi:head-tail connector protein [Pediococcus claussenii]|uniref:head-tail connector protein n=1 Tax=Pediococcus claussenii TaxID=187452 RepID=UPI00081AAB09|nr:head-tail connector protein [Pediococcus claussenii]ANZ70370.1 hypothetical protein AYR57_08600 [Pediococcus claussenii]ANZ72186.1 hypothetical protein AYR58_08600 [Pediococcus claussenii]
MAIDLQTLKNSLRIDGEKDDNLLKQNLSAAQSYIRNAIDSEAPDAFFELATVSDIYEIAVLALASTYYNNRSSLGVTQTFAVDLTLESIIGQLRGMYESYCLKQAEDTNESN